MSKSTEVAAPASTAVADWQKELAGLTQLTQETEKAQSNWISFRGGRLQVNGEVVSGDKMKVVVIHNIFENQWYSKPFDPDTPATPDCYAMGEHEEELKPHPDSPDPQSPMCKGCPKNEWKSDPGGGKGKACKNVRRLAMIPADALKSPEAIQKSEVALAKLPITSVRNWSAYALQITNVLKLPPIAVVSEVSVVPDNKTIFQVNWALVDKIVDGALIQALLGKRKDVTPLVFAGYVASTPAAEAAAGPKKF